MEVVHTQLHVEERRKRYVSELRVGGPRVFAVMGTHVVRVSAEDRRKCLDNPLRVAYFKHAYYVLGTPCRTEVSFSVAFQCFFAHHANHRATRSIWVPGNIVQT